MQLLKPWEPIVSWSIAPLEKHMAQKMVNEFRKRNVLWSIDLAMSWRTQKQLYGIFEQADPQYLYDELSAWRVIWWLDSVLNRSDTEVQTALYFIKKFHKARRNKTDYAINVTMEDNPKEENKATLSLSQGNNETMFVQLYKKRPVPATMPADLKEQLQDLMQHKARYTEYEGYRYHHTDQKSMGQWYSNYTIITDMQNSIVAITWSSSVVFFGTKRPTISFTGKNFYDECVQHNVASYSDGYSHFRDATGDPEWFFNTIREYLKKPY